MTRESFLGGQRSLYIRLGLAVVMVCSAFALSGCSMSLRPLSDTVEEELELSLDRGFDGIIVYVNQAGDSRFYASGWDNREKQITADPHALFKIASISKLYMAAATAQLVADGALSLDQTLAELIPEVEGRIENAETISLKMMVKHRSGIPEYIEHPDFKSDTDEPYLKTIALIFDEGADFRPGKKYAYSNTNYLIIGEILDRTLGYSHHRYIRDEILTPLGLNNTYSLYTEVDSNDVMSGYLVGWDPDLKNWDHTGPGGSMVATAEDVGLFLRALIDGTLFTEEEQAIYTSIYEYEHTGWVPGYTSIARYHVDIDAVVVQFVNTSSGQLFWLDLNKVYNRIVRILENES